MNLQYEFVVSLNMSLTHTWFLEMTDLFTLILLLCHHIDAMLSVDTQISMITLLSENLGQRPGSGLYSKEITLTKERTGLC